MVARVQSRVQSRVQARVRAQSRLRMRYPHIHATQPWGARTLPRPQHPTAPPPQRASGKKAGPALATPCRYHDDPDHQRRFDFGRHCARVRHHGCSHGGSCCHDGAGSRGCGHHGRGQTRGCGGGHSHGRGHGRSRDRGRDRVCASCVPGSRRRNRCSWHISDEESSGAVQMHVCLCNLEQAGRALHGSREDRTAPALLVGGAGY